MRSLSRVTLLLGLGVACLAPLVLTTACERGETASPDQAGDPVDARVEALLGALEDSDRDALATLCTAALGSELGDRDLSVFARTLHWLGGATLALESEAPVVDGVRRRYTVRFDRGEVELEVTVVKGKIEGFSLEEERWQALVDRSLEASAGSLRVADFHFEGPEGEAVDAPPEPRSISYSVSFEGLDAQLREHHVTIGKSVVDGEGREVYRQDDPDNIRFPQAETGSSGGRLTGNFGVPGPGEYTLILEIHDLVAGQDMRHEVEFEIEIAAAAAEE